MNDYTPTGVPFMNYIITQELGKTAQQFNKKREAIVERVFPDHSIPFDLEILLSALSGDSPSHALNVVTVSKPPHSTAPDLQSPPVEPGPVKPQRSYHWTEVPDLATPGGAGVREAEVATYFNKLAQKIIRLEKYAKSLVVLRTEFTAFYCSNAICHTPGKTLKNSTMDRKPDVTGIKPFTNGNIDALAPEDITWLLVRLILELKCGILEKFNFFNNIHVDICGEGYLIFAEQINRRFIITVSLYQYNMYFGLITRAGVLYIKCFHINNRPKLFLRIVLGIMFADDVFLGYDPTMHIERDGTGTLFVRDRKLRIKRQAFRNCVIRGRATTILICEMDEEDADGKKRTITVAVKDTWVIKGRWRDEGHFYEKANRLGVRNIPHLIDSWIVVVNGMEDSTENIPGFETGFEIRVHRRFIFRGYGEPLSCFESKREFIYALIDALIGAPMYIFNQDSDIDIDTPSSPRLAL